MEHEHREPSFAMRITGSGHPINEVRVERLRAELERWHRERERVLGEIREAQAQRS